PPAIGPITGTRNSKPAAFVAVDPRRYVNKPQSLVVKQRLSLGRETRKVILDGQTTGPVSASRYADPLALTALDETVGPDQPQLVLVEEVLCLLEKARQVVAYPPAISPITVARNADPATRAILEESCDANQPPSLLVEQTLCLFLK